VLDPYPRLKKSEWSIQSHTLLEVTFFTLY
jgi:hypothetical protein